MAKARKPFVSRKKRKELDAARQRRETFLLTQAQRGQDAQAVAPVSDKSEVALPPTATVGEFAEALGLPVVRVIAQLMKSGIMAAIGARLDFDTMSIVADELGFVTVPEEEGGVDVAEAQQVITDIPVSEHAITRPPIVAVMGHVDHGKTTLLDRIRQASVASGEHGGITQHIGAYQAEVTYEGQQRQITFLDTPGHAAFTALRSHGAHVTDIVILVVSADDGVMPQTIEAINHAKSANVAVIVAITKADLPGANPERVKQQLVENGLVPEEWGGTIPMIAVSAVTGENVQALLEYVVLTADLKGYKADPSANAQGLVIESHQEVGLGPVATFLVQNGTLNVGDILVTGKTYGKIRSMMDYRGKRIVEAPPSTPVRVSGLGDLPEFGDSFTEVATEREARAILAKSERHAAPSRTISDISRAIADGAMDSLKLILKADAQGSLEALRSSLNRLQQPGVKPLIIHSGVGDVSLTDIQLAGASQAIVLGFQVNVAPPIKRAAHNLGVTVYTYKIIYDLLDQVELILKGLVKTETIQVEQGRLKVKKVFRQTKEMQIVGGEITQGRAVAPAIISINRDGETVGTGKLTTLQKGPESVRELESGQECGVSLTTKAKVQEGDVLVFFIEEEVIAKMESE